MWSLRALQLWDSGIFFFFRKSRLPKFVLSLLSMWLTDSHEDAAWITNKDPLRSTRNSAQYSVIT